MKKTLLRVCLTLCLCIMAGSAFAGAIRIKLANNLADDHPTSQALAFFKDKVEADSNKSIRIQLFNNATLGSETEAVQQLKNGAVEISRSSASNLENFDSIYKVFALPYLFTSKDNFYQVMSGPIAEELFLSTRDSGYIGLTFYDSGSRSFYTKNKPIYVPEDLKGQKLRVMNSQTAIKMVTMMGGIPTPMAYGEIYPALQQGVIDGAENNVTALTLGRHGEVVKYYSYDEHNMIPDILIIATPVWEKMTPEQRKIVKDAAVASTAWHKERWIQAEQDAARIARDELGVAFNQVEKQPFIDITKPLYDEYVADPAIKNVVEAIRATQN